MLSINEGKSCDAIIRHLETREGFQRRDLQLIEEHHNSPVEMICTIGGRLFAFEHTVVEPFAGHVQMNAEADLHFQPIIDALEGTLPPETIQLNIPAKVFQGMKKPDIQKIQGAIVDWVKQTAPALPVRQYSDYIGDIGPVVPPDVPFEVTLYRFDPLQYAGRFQIVHVVTEDRDLARTARINTVCEKKFPKLAAWKRDKGARTILILEDNDIQLSNQASVAQAYLPLAQARDDRPDETYLVVTCMNPWWAWPILVDNVTLFDFAKNEQTPGWEVNMPELMQLTKR